MTDRRRPARRGRARGFIVGIAVFVVVAGLGAATAIVVNNRVETGEWEMPKGDDLVRIKDRFAREGEGPPEAIYLHRGAIDLAPGPDDASRGRSSVVMRASDKALRMPGFSGSNRQWRSIVRCVRDLFAPFDIIVTEALPLTDDYILVAVGGRADDLGPARHRGHVSGLAPFSPGTMIPRAVVFAFADEVKNRPRKVCEVAGMEVGHALGLDHAHHCKDVMTYLDGCGAKSFTDHDARCGEDEPRPCADGSPTQNSRRRLLEILGPATP